MGEDTRQHVVQGQLFSNIAGMGMSFPLSHEEEEGRAHMEPLPFGTVRIRDSKTI